MRHQKQKRTPMCPGSDTSKPANGNNAGYQHGYDVRYSPPHAPCLPGHTFMWVENRMLAGSSGQTVIISRKKIFFMEQRGQLTSPENMKAIPKILFISSETRAADCQSKCPRQQLVKRPVVLSESCYLTNKEMTQQRLLIDDHLT